MKIILFYGLLFSLFSCGWAERDLVQRAVWSDDDQRQTYTRVRYEEKQSALPDPSNNAEQRKFEYAILSKSSGGTDLLADWRAGEISYQLYDMHSRNYIIYAPFVGNTLTFRQRFNDGQEREVFRTARSPNGCTQSDVIPSPDGRLLANVSRNEIEGGSAEGYCPNGRLNVDILDADSLQVLAKLEDADVAGSYDSVWSKEGYFYAVADSQSFRWVPDAVNFSESPRPSCIYPATTSSTISADAVQIVGNTIEPSDPILVTDNIVEAFGCP